MRITACSLAIVALGIVATASAQAPQLLRVDAGGGARMLTPAKAPYTGGGLVLAATPLKPGVTPRVSQFRIRAWSEAPAGGRGGGVRVVVSAIHAQQREAQIASVLVAMDKAVEIAAPETFNARHMTVTLGTSASLSRAPAPMLPATWRVETGRGGPWRGDVPTDPGLSPWPPPPRGSR